MSKLKMHKPEPEARYQDVALSEYDYIVVSSSGGKDSQAMLSWLVRRAILADVADRLIVVHADLGRVEWQGTKELAQEQAKLCGVPFRVVSRIGTVSNGQSKGGTPLYAKGEVRGDILDQVQHRAAQLKADGKESPAWMGPGMARWCTSDHKRGPIEAEYTQIAKQWRELTGLKRPCRILDCQGLRSQESKSRAGKPNFTPRKRSSTQSIDTWLPIQDWSVEQVWREIEVSGLPYHYAYKLGMPRLSCVFCIFAPKDALLIAGKHNRELLSDYVAVERETGYTFQQGRPLADIEAALEAGEAVPSYVSEWQECQ